MDITLEKIRQFSDDQYSNENRLNARIQIYRFCEKKLTWRAWVFDKLDFQNVKNVLELGCGTGLFWKENIDKVSPDLHIVLSDLSPGMVEAARKTFSEYAGRLAFKVVDACRIPFPDSSFQMVIANHMLYHVDDKPLAFAEMSRVLSDDGYIYASTLSTRNWRELFRGVARFHRDFKHDNVITVQSFNAENGEAILSPYFSDIEKFVFENDIIIRDIEPLILYLASCYSPRQLNLLIENIADFRAYLKSLIDKTGEIRISNTGVLFKFRKKRQG